MAAQCGEVVGREKRLFPSLRVLQDQLAILQEGVETRAVLVAEPNPAPKRPRGTGVTAPPVSYRETSSQSPSGCLLPYGPPHGLGPYWFQLCHCEQGQLGLLPWRVGPLEAA